MGLGTRAVVVAALAAVMLSSAPSSPVALAQVVRSDRLDTTFGSGGIVTTDVSTHTLDSANAAVLDSSGRLVVAGSSDGHFAVVRHTTAGALDTSFGSDGKVLTDVATPAFPDELDGARAVAIQSDGKIVAAGNAGEDFAVVRYNTDGSLDTSFSTDGKVTTDIGTDTVDAAYAMAVQSDGKIVVAGTSDANDFVVVRYTSAGALDTSFDSDGKVTTDIGTDPSINQAYAVAVQTDGKLVVAGQVNHDFAVARYTAAGALDTSFDSDGKVTTDIGTDTFDFANAVAVQSDGKIVVAGSSGDDFAAVRYTAAGALDTTFSTDGKVTTNFETDSLDSANAVAIDSNGKIVVAGNSEVTPSGSDRLGHDFAAVRYTAAGALDSSFGTDGKVTTDTSTQQDGARRYGERGDHYGVRSGGHAVAVQSDGKIVVAGTGGADFKAARYTSAGALDSSYGTGGIATTDVGPHGRDRGYAAAVQPDGKIIVAAESTVTNDGSDFTVLRYTSAGALDSSYGTGGAVTTDTSDTGIGIEVDPHDGARAVAIQSDGNIVVAGRSGFVWAVARYTSGGSPDTAFGLLDAAHPPEDMVRRGFTNTSSTGDTGNGDGGRAVAVQSDGKIVVAGTFSSSSSVHNFGVARYNADGSLDTAFDTDGRVSTAIGSDTEDFGYAVAIQSDGKIVVAGTSGDDFAVVRYTTAGALDTDFSTDGKVTTDIGSSTEDFAYAVAIQSDGKIVVAGTSGDDFAGSALHHRRRARHRLQHRRQGHHRHRVEHRGLRLRGCDPVRRQDRGGGNLRRRLRGGALHHRRRARHRLQHRRQGHHRHRVEHRRPGEHHGAGLQRRHHRGGNLRRRLRGGALHHRRRARHRLRHRRQGDHRAAVAPRRAAGDGGASRRQGRPRGNGRQHRLGPGGHRNRGHASRQPPRPPGRGERLRAPRGC